MHITGTTQPKILSNKTLTGKKRSQKDIMYQIAIKGQKAYAFENWKALSLQKQKEVLAFHKKCNQIINLLKQEICNKITSSLFGHLFPGSELAKGLATKQEYDPTFEMFLSFKDLGITRSILTERLIRDNVFPKNYYSLQ
jgi:uncharacterized protein YaiL (DUF2058 family)